jgi:hypothetical protein
VLAGLLLALWTTALALAAARCRSARYPVTAPAH